MNLDECICFILSIFDKLVMISSGILYLINMISLKIIIIIKKKFLIINFI